MPFVSTRDNVDLRGKMCYKEASDASHGHKIQCPDIALDLFEESFKGQMF